jgi:hypothetical protein
MTIEAILTHHELNPDEKVPVILPSDPAVWLQPLPKPPVGVQYRLVAKKNGIYPVYARGFENSVNYIYLNKGQTWKIGETMKWDSVTRKQGRYTNSELNFWGVQFVGERQGTQEQIKMWEQQQLFIYQIMNGWQLPAGNKMRR